MGKGGRAQLCDTGTLMAILVVAALVRLIGIRFGLPHPQCRPDETSIVAVTNGFYLGDLNPNFFYYPAFFMMALAGVLLAWLWLGRVLGYVDGAAGMDALMTAATVTLAARLLSAAAGVATVWMIYGVAKRLFDRTTALVSAVFLALAFLHVRDSHFGVTDVAATFLGVVSFYWTVRLADGGRLRDLVIAGLAAGLATSTKYNLALVAAPALVTIVAGGSRSVFSSATLGRVALFGALMATAFVAGSPYSLIEWREMLSALQQESRHLAMGHGVVLGRGWVVHLTTTLRYGIGVPMLLAAVGGLVWLTVRDARKGLLVAAFPLVYFLVLGSGYTVFTRYMTPIVPFLCLAAGYAVTEAGRWVGTRSGLAIGPRLAVWTTAALVVAPAAWSTIQFDRLISRTDNRLVAASWVEKRFPDGASVAHVGPEGGRIVPFAGDAVRSARFPASTYDPTSPGTDVIVVQTSPLYPADGNDAAIASIEGRYVLAAEFRVARAHPADVYDRQDEFYVPFAGFEGTSRPGPNLAVYVRR